MRSLPRKAQLYVVLVYALGLLAVIGSELLPTTPTSAAAWELVVFAALGALAGSRKVTLIRRKEADDSVSMSLGFILTAATMLRFGPSAAMVVGALSTLCGCVFPKRSRQRPHQVLFNVMLSLVETWASGVLFLWINGGTLHLEPLRSFPAVIAYSLSCFLINTGGVAVIIALCSGQKPVPVWRETFLWTGPSYVAGACISTLAILILGSNTGAILLFAGPVAYLMYQSYTVYIARAEEKQQHIAQLELSKAQLADLYLATIKSLALAIDAKDQYTHQHILRVQRYAMATAQKLGLSGNDLEGLNTGALLHDIGKLGVPEYVLLKPGRLTDEEFAKIKKHPEIGAAILDPVPFPWPVLPVVKYHHEKWDGTGYPEGLKGEEIPLTARILAVADAYDAITSTRSYRNARTHAQAVAIIRKDSGTHFDPEIAAAFLEVIDPIVEEMARESQGPLAPKPSALTGSTPKAEQAVRDIQRASSELWALYEVAQTLSSSLGLQETLDILARKLEAILPGTACLFLLKKESAESLEARAVVGVNKDFFVGCRTLSARCRSVQVATTRKTYLGEYDPDDLLLTSSQMGQWTHLDSALIVPIVHQGEVLGTINLYHPQPDAFGPHDMQLLEMISERAAMALYNGLLFDRTRSHAITDPLTGLFNLRHLTEDIEEKCHRSIPENQFSVLCLDVDSFKPINDNFGHLEGDRVLKDLANILRSVTGPNDTVARYGGDEFIIVLDGAGKDEAARVIDRLKATVEAYDADLIHPKLGHLHLGFSIGCACFPEDGDDCATLISSADAHMYHDKTERKLRRLAERPATTTENATRVDNTIDAASTFRRAA